MKAPDTLLDLLHASPGERTAIIVPELGLRLTYDALRRQVMALAEALAATGIHHTDRVASLLPNGLPAIVTFLASSIAATAAPLNPAYPYEELFFFLGDTSAQVLLCPAHGADQARSAATDRAIRVYTVEMDSEGTVHLVERRERSEVTPPQPEDVALVLHTSGSTGRPKRVPLQHHNLAISAANIAQTYELTPDDVSLCVMPLFHIHGLVASTLATLVSGGTVVVPTKFNPFDLLANRARTPRDLVFGSAHHAPTAAGALPRPQASLRHACASCVRPALPWVPRSCKELRTSSACPSSRPTA